MPIINKGRTEKTATLRKFYSKPTIHGSGMRVTVHHPLVLARRGADVVLEEAREMPLFGETQRLGKQAQGATTLAVEPGKGTLHPRRVEQQVGCHAGLLAKQRIEVRA